MMTTKKCAVCGYKFTFDNEIRTNLFISDKNVGAKAYFDLWHFSVVRCPKCGYASADIDTCQNKKIVKDKNYKLDNPEMVEKLNEARPNLIDTYLYAEKYYESIGDTLNQAKCLFQSADLVYAELMYWEEYILDEDDLDDDPDYIEIVSFAEELFSKGLKVLGKYIESNPSDYDAKILRSGILSDGDSVQKIQGIKELKSLSTIPNLTTTQQAMVEYLLKGI